MLSEKPWKPVSVLFLLSGIFICLSCASSLIMAVQFFHREQKLDETSLGYLILATMSLHGSILLPTGIFLWRYRIGPIVAFGFSASRKWVAILLGICTAIVFLPVGMILQEVSLQLLHLLHINGPEQPAVMTLQKIQSPAARIYMAIFTVIIAPVAEEVFFRGILYPTLKQVGYPRLALWGTSLAFAAIHMTPGIFLPLTVLALFLVMLYEKTGNLLAPITAHAFFNAIGLVEIYYGEYLAGKFSELLHHFR
jgi:membrane protease YdiL (CAAX protease family)